MFESETTTNNIKLLKNMLTISTSRTAAQFTTNKISNFNPKMTL